MLRVVNPNSEYMAMRIFLAESAWVEALDGFSRLKMDEKIKRLRKVEMLAEEISNLKEGRS